MTHCEGKLTRKSNAEIPNNSLNDVQRKVINTNMDTGHYGRLERLILRNYDERAKIKELFYKIRLLLNRKSRKSFFHVKKNF